MGLFRTFFYNDLIARVAMAESGLGGRFRFKAASAGKDARIARRTMLCTRHASRLHLIRQCTENQEIFLDLELSDVTPLF
jgi:hypothetical protein